MTEGRVAYNPRSVAQNFINASSLFLFPFLKPRSRIPNSIHRLRRTHSRLRVNSFILHCHTWACKQLIWLKWEFQQLRLPGYSQPSRDPLVLRGDSRFCNMGLRSSQPTSARSQSISLDPSSHWGDVHFHLGSRGDVTLGIHGVACGKGPHATDGRAM